MIAQCQSSSRCLIQKYENLVLKPVKETRKIFDFLNIPWDEKVLHHEKHISGIKMSSWVVRGTMSINTRCCSVNALDGLHV